MLFIISSTAIAGLMCSAGSQLAVRTLEVLPAQGPSRLETRDCAGGGVIQGEVALGIYQIVTERRDWEDTLGGYGEVCVGGKMCH